MSDSQGSPLSYPRIERYRWALLVAWTGIILGLLVVDYWQLHNGIERIALTEARAYFMKDQAFRQWSTLHGGVYVPSTEATPPNPYLAHIPERDIETPSGKRLTLMNPAYVVRQMNDQFANLYGIVGHITSLKPLRPENSPDEWERQALEAFHLGEKEIREFTEIQDVPYLRLMKPMITQKGCLKCHSHQGYQVGDVRGGVSVSLPMASLLAHRNEGTFWHGMVSLVLWILGCLGIVLGSRRIQAQTREQERVEETQRESEARHRALVEMLPDGVCLLDGDRRVVLANPQGRAQLDTLAVRAADGSLTHLGGYLAEEMLESMEGVHEIAVQSGQQTFELRFQKIGEDGSGWAMVMQDVTQDLLIQEQLQQQERLAAVGQLAAGIAHDFNNILSVIMSSAQVIEISEEMSLQSREDLREISSQAKQAAQLIQQILDFSRQTSAEKQVVDLADFVKEAVKLLLRTLPEHIRVTTHIESGDLQIKANLTQLQQVLTNLAVNARDAMPVGGELRVGIARLQLEEGDTPPVLGMPLGPWAVFTVEDTGAGMNAQIHRRIFEPFFTTKARGEGTGLGLAQVYGLVKQHDGEIAVRSREGEGTQFTIYLPEISEVQVPDEVQEEEIPRGHGEMILVVEDESILVEVIRRMLAVCNYQVLTAANGGEGLRVYAAHRDEVALVLTDVVMPEMGGLAMLERLWEEAPQLPAIVMTGYSSRLKNREGFPPNVSHVLDKPLEMYQTLQAVSQALTSRAGKG